MDFNDLLKKQGIDPSHVLVLRHTPVPKLRAVFGWLAADHPAVFNAYQQTQKEDVEKEMKQATYVVSFIGNPPGFPDALFVGLYRRHGEEIRTLDQIRADPAIQQLELYGVPPETQSRLWFDLRLEENFYPTWKGRLVIQWS